jgi:hypothetical protein
MRQHITQSDPGGHERGRVLMTPIGLLIVLLCFVGPILSPVIGMVVGAIYDVFTRSGEGLGMQTRLRLRQRRAEAA